MGMTAIGKQAFGYPMPVALIGALYDGKPNFMTAAWFTRANMDPPVMAVALGKDHMTTAGARAYKTFSLNIPGCALVAETDYCGLVSGKDADKSEVFEVFYGDLATAPMPVACPICMECKVLEAVSFSVDVLLIGEVVEVYADEQVLTNGQPDITKIAPFVLTMPDNRYWALGEVVANAWSIGKTYQAKRGNA